MSTSRQVGCFRCLILALLLHSSGVFGVEWGEIRLLVDEQQFTFDIVVQDLPASMSTSRLSIYTKSIIFFIPTNQEQFLVDFTSGNGAVLGGPIVQPLGVPTLDRWQNGAVNDFTISETSPGTWRFTGTITNGNDPYMPCDRIVSIVVGYPGGSLVQNANVIKAVPFPSMSIAVNPSSKLVTNAGQIVEYQYVVWNDGDEVLHDVAVSDDNVDAEPVCNFFANDELFPRGEPYSKVVCTAQHTVTPEEMEAEGPVTNHVSVTSDKFGPVNSTVTIPTGLFISGFESPQNILTVLDNTSCDVGRDSSIAIAANGYPVISYYDLIEGTVKFIKCNDAACAGHDEIFSILDDFTNGETSIALRKDDLPVISYQKYDELGSYLNVVKCNDSSCVDGNESISSVDGPANDLGSHSSMKNGADGHPVISYFDQEVLRVAKCNDPSCTGGDETISIVDGSPGGSGAWSSLAIGVDGYPVISYQQADPGILKLAKCNNLACSGGGTSIVVLDDSTENAGQYTSLAIGADGFPIISYSNFYDNELRVVKCDDAACADGGEIRSVVDAQAAGWTAIAIGDDGLPVIAYTGNGNQFALKVIKCNDTACTGNDEITSLLDPVSTGYISMVIGEGGLPVISYFDNESRMLKVAHCGTASCSQLKVTP